MEDAQTLSNKGILVKNLVGRLAEMGRKDVQGLFSSFGDIASVDVEVNPVTGKNKGFAIVMFDDPLSAANAIKAMNGYLVNGAPIEVNQLPSYLAMGNRPSMVDDESRLRQKHLDVKRSEEARRSQYALPDPEGESDPLVRSFIGSVKGSRFYSEEPTRVVGLFNLFDTKDEGLCRDRRFLDRLVSDVEEFVNTIAEVREARLQHEKNYGLYLRFRESHYAKRVFKEMRDGKFDQRTIVCAFFEKEVLDKI